MTVHRCGSALLLATLAIAACDDRRGRASGELSTNWTPDRADEIRDVPTAEVIAEIQRELGGKRLSPLTESQWQSVRQLYAQFGGRPLWLNEDGLNEERAGGLMRSLADADSDAIRLDLYPLREVSSTIAAIGKGKEPTAAQLAAADVALTSAYVAFGENMLIGQVPPTSLKQSWHINAQDEQVDSALVRTLRIDSLSEGLARMRPQDPGYQGLRRELARFRRIVADGGWGPVPAGRSLRRGDRDAPTRLDALRVRLHLEGLLGDTTSDAAEALRRARTGSPVYDARLAAAVANFQARHGIAVDSMLGKETVTALNVPAEYRLAQIAANLERFRWMPRSLGDRYIVVNVPRFYLDAYDSGQKKLEMKVIVGAEYQNRATPVFSDSMELVIFRPYWNVTPSIAEKELWPAARADPGYLARNGYQVVTTKGKTRLRQVPGEKNALGLVKFMFPNDFNIYLHDTPNHNLFAKDVRALSHGCIRLEQPAKLAEFVLGWPMEKIEQQMASGPNDNAVRLSRKIPVYIVYFTAYMKDDQLHFANDLYDRDNTLIEAVAPGAMPSPEAVRDADALREIVWREPRNGVN